LITCIWSMYSLTFFWQSCHKRKLQQFRHNRVLCSNYLDKWMFGAWYICKGDSATGWRNSQFDNFSFIFYCSNDVLHVGRRVKQEVFDHFIARFKGLVRRWSCVVALHLREPTVLALWYRHFDADTLLLLSSSSFVFRLICHEHKCEADPWTPLNTSISYYSKRSCIFH
jgi:hypothetical protein